MVKRPEGLRCGAGGEDTEEGKGKERGTGKKSRRDELSSGSLNINIYTKYTQIYACSLKWHQ